MEPTYTVALEGGLSDFDTVTLMGRLAAHADGFAPVRNYAAVAVTLRDEAGALQGGLLGSTLWGWLQVDVLWVQEGLRRQGQGSRLLVLAEAHAVALGCCFARLETFDPGARAFYERHGYDVYGELEDFPVGHTQYCLRKRLGVGRP